MTFVTGTFAFTCNKCGTQHDFPATDADFEDGYEDASPQASSDTVFVWDFALDCDNPACNNEIEVQYEVWQSAQKTFSKDELTIGGGTLVSAYGYTFA